MEEVGGTNATVQPLREAARTEKEPRLETEGLGVERREKNWPEGSWVPGARREPTHLGPVIQPGSGVNLETEVGFSKKINIFDLGGR